MNKEKKKKEISNGKPMVHELLGGTSKKEPKSFIRRPLHLAKREENATPENREDRKK